MSSCALLVFMEPSERYGTRKSPLSGWLQLANFGTLAVVCLVAYRAYSALHRFYAWLTKPSPHLDHVRVILVLGPKTDLNRAILQRLSDKFQTPVTLLNENEPKIAAVCTRRHLIFAGEWAPANQQDVFRLSSFIKSHFGCVDVLVVSDVPQHETPSSSNFLSQLNRELLTQFWIAMGFLPGMLERNRGDIVSVALGTTSSLANAGVMRTVYEDILQKDTKVTLTLVEKNSVLARFLPASLSSDLVAPLVVDSIGYQSIFQFPSVFNYLFHLPKVIVRIHLKPFLDYFQRRHSTSKKTFFSYENSSSNIGS